MVRNLKAKFFGGGPVTADVLSLKKEMTAMIQTRTSWRMQLHPSDSANSTRLASESLSAGFIGLDFATDIGDLHVTEYSNLPDGQRDY